MYTTVEFKSKQFPSYNDDTEGLNYSVGIYGKRLADYLCEELSKQGIEVLDAYAEDWGWCIELKHQGKYKLIIGCCGNNQNPSEEYFTCFIHPNKPTIRKWFRKIDVSSNIEKMYNALNSILTDNTHVYDVTWKINSE